MPRSGGKNATGSPGSVTSHPPATNAISEETKSAASAANQPPIDARFDAMAGQPADQKIQPRRTNPARNSADWKRRFVRNLRSDIELTLAAGPLQEVGAAGPEKILELHRKRKIDVLGHRFEFFHRPDPKFVPGVVDDLPDKDLRSRSARRQAEDPDAG